MQPPPQALIYAQDKLAMRRKLAELGAPVPAYAEVTWADDVVRFGAEHGWPVVIKAIRGGYDGRGVWMHRRSDEAEAIVTEQLDKGVAAASSRRRSTMRRELSAMVARSPFGQGATWPVVETVQRNGQCAVVIAPAPALSDDSVAEAAEELALRIASEISVWSARWPSNCSRRPTARSLVNELAMRPHNSGPLDAWTVPAPRSSSSICAPSSTTRSATPRRSRRSR